MIKAIETHYKGYRFRSRLEARWAVLFDALNIEWEYEKEGYVLKRAGRYLPDFWLPAPNDVYPEAGYFVEIKGEEPNPKSFRKSIELAKQSKHTCYILIGAPGKHKHFWVHNSGNRGWIKGIEHPINENEMLLSGPECSIQLLGHQTQAESAISINEAISKARSARFEYGERT